MEQLLEKGKYQGYRIIHETSGIPTGSRSVITDPAASKEAKLKNLSERYGSVEENFEKDLKVIFSSCCYSRREYTPFTLTLNNIPGGTEWLREQQRSAQSNSGQTGVMYRTPERGLLVGESLVKDDAGANVGVYNPELNILWLSIELPYVFSIDTEKLSITGILYKLIALATGTYDAYGDTLLKVLSESYAKKAEDIEVQKLRKTSEAFHKSLFSNTDLGQTERLIASTQAQIASYHEQMAVLVAEKTRLERDYDFKKTYYAQAFPSKDEVLESIAQIRLLKKVRSITPHPSGAGFIIKTKPLSLLKITATNAAADQYFFGTKEISLPEGKYILGEYNISIYLRNGTFLVTPNDVQYGIHSPEHGHAKTTGETCWGPQLLEVIHNTKNDADLLMLVTSVIRFLESQNEGDSYIKIKALCANKKWDWVQLLADARTVEGKSILEAAGGSPFVLIKQGLKTSDIFHSGTIRAGSLADCAKDDYKANGHGRWLRVIGAGRKADGNEDEETFSAICNCGQRYMVAAEMIERDGTIEDYLKYHYPNIKPEDIQKATVVLVNSAVQDLNAGGEFNVNNLV